MATKLQITPTTNFFALLADDEASQPPKKKTEARPATKETQELTPAARAAIKAEEERRKKEAAEKKAKQQAEATQTPSSPQDLEGFCLQRNQRVKEKRFAQPEAKPIKPFNKGERKPHVNYKDNKKENTVNLNGPSSDGDETKPVSNANDGNYLLQGNKPFNKGNFRPDNRGQKGSFKNQNQQNQPHQQRAPRGDHQKDDGATRGRGREFDKQSQGKLSRQPQAKRQGHGKANWGGDDEAASWGAIPAPETRPADDAWGLPHPDSTEAAPITSETPSTENVPETPAVENEQTVPVQTPVDPEEAKLGFDDFLKARALKQQELAAKVGLTRDGPRDITEEEKKNLEKFTIVPNVKIQSEVSKNSQNQKDSAKIIARKGEKLVAVDSVFTVNLPRVDGFNEGRGRRGRGRGEGGAAREGGRGEGGRGEGGRGEGGVSEGEGGRGAEGGVARGGGRGQSGSRGGGAGRGNRGGKGGNSQKIVKSEVQFPSLG